MRSILALASILFTIATQAQQWQADLQLGQTGYSGDLTKSSIDFHTVRPAVQANIKYKLTDYLTLRAGILYGNIVGHDNTSKDSSMMARNLSFQTAILEGRLCVEVNLLPPDLFSSYPYLFVGVGVFHFNPYTHSGNEKIYLQPLGTEGEGLSDYPDRKMYSLTQFCIPMGGGIKLKVTDKLYIGAEIGFRKLFTDYLDDVSKTYVDPEVLEGQRGPQALAMAFRGPNGGYPHVGAIRGNPGKKDCYYFGGIKFTWHFGTGNGNSESKSIKRQEKETKSKSPLKLFPQRQ